MFIYLINKSQQLATTKGIIQRQGEKNIKIKTKIRINQHPIQNQDQKRD